MKKSKVFRSNRLMCGECKSDISRCDNCLKYLKFGDEVYCDEAVGHLCKECLMFDTLRSSPSINL